MSDPVTPMDPAKVARTEYEATHHSYLGRDAVALDDFVDALTDGPLDETISARMARWATESKFGTFKHFIGTKVCQGLNLIDKDHGAGAEIGDLARAQAEAATEQAAPTVQQEKP